MNHPKDKGTNQKINMNDVRTHHDSLDFSKPSRFTRPGVLRVEIRNIINQSNKKNPKLGQCPRKGQRNEKGSKTSKIDHSPQEGK